MHYKRSRDSSQLELLGQEMPTTRSSSNLQPTAGAEQKEPQNEAPREVLYLSQNFVLTAWSRVLPAETLGLPMLSDEVSLKDHVLQLTVLPIFIQTAHGSQTLINSERLRTPIHIHPQQAVRARCFAIDEPCSSLEFDMIKYLLARHDSTEHHPARGRTTTKRVVTERDRLLAAAFSQSELTARLHELLNVIVGHLKADTVQRIVNRSKRTELD